MSILRAYRTVQLEVNNPPSRARVACSDPTPINNLIISLISKNAYRTTSISALIRSLLVCYRCFQREVNARANACDDIRAKNILYSIFIVALQILCRKGIY